MDKVNDITEVTANGQSTENKSAVNISNEKSIWKTIFVQGIWTNNSTVVQLLGLCPLLAVSNTATNALDLGLATLLVLTCTNTVVFIFRKHIPNEIRIPIYVMIIATTVTVVQLLMNAYRTRPSCPAAAVPAAPPGRPARCSRVSHSGRRSSLHRSLACRR